MPSVLFVYTPCKNLKAANALAKKLLEHRLIACANIVSSESLYHWAGRMQNEQEMILIAKTLPNKEKIVRSFIEKVHTYELPCIASWKITVNKKYAEWVAQQVK